MTGLYHLYIICILFLHVYLRYYGVNDPVAEKLLRQTSNLPKLTPPDDKGITSLYIGGMGHLVTEKDLRFV